MAERLWRRMDGAGGEGPMAFAVGPWAFERLPEGVLVIEQPDKEERTWYCERFGAAGYGPLICADYKHRENGYDCGERLLVKPAAGKGN